MTHFASRSAALLLLSLPAAVSATVFTFSANETSALSPSEVKFSFQLDTSKAVLATGGTTTFPEIGIDRNGVRVPANTVFAEYGTSLGSPLFYFIDTGATPFSAGAGTGIAFTTGRFAIADGATDGVGTLNISTVPEPSVWLFGILGVGLVGATLRGRRNGGASAVAV